jgi:lipopolysaccharide biosynthesis glycosyltransferase
MDFNEQVGARIREWVGAWPQRPDHNALFRVLRFVSHWRSAILANTYLSREGAIVHGGLFQGMRYLDRPSQGMLLPRLLGVYESELHPYLEAFLKEGPEAIIDIGCAEGYYAVGLARVAHGVTVHAHDIDENARNLCAELARRNGVADRVIIGGEFKPEDFQAFAGRRALVLVDAEGAEVDILDPAKAPALAGMPIIVETHDLFRPGAEAAMVSRFSETHEITRVLPRPKTFDIPAWMREFNDLDLQLAAWEFRDRPTPWLVMRPRLRAGAEANAAARQEPEGNRPTASVSGSDTKPLPVVFALHDAKGNYWLNTAVALTSVAQHAKGPIELHVLHDDTLSALAKQRLTAIARELRTPLKLTPVQPPPSLPVRFSRQFSPACVFRLMIPKLFPEAEAVVYLDSDLVSNGVDVREIAAAAPADAPISAVLDPNIAVPQRHREVLAELGLDSASYFNSGVLVIRPALIEEDLVEACLAFSEAYPSALHADQDFLNHHFAGRFARLEQRFNDHIGIYDQAMVRPLSELGGKVLHYAGKVKPLDGWIAPGLIPFLAHAHLVPEIIQGGMYEVSGYLLPSQEDPHGLIGQNVRPPPKRD